jgi:hypothetical protein
MEIVIVIVALIAFVGVRQWLNQAQSDDSPEAPCCY